MKKSTSTQFLYEEAIAIAKQQEMFNRSRETKRNRLYSISITNNLGNTHIITNSEEAFDIACATERTFHNRRLLCFNDFDRESYKLNTARHIISDSMDADKFAKNFDNAVLMSSPIETELGDPTKRVFTLIAGDNLGDVTDFILDQTKVIAEYDQTQAKDRFSSTGLRFLMLADAVVDGKQAAMKHGYSAMGDKTSSVDTNLRYLGFSIMHDMKEAHENNRKSKSEKNIEIESEKN